MGKTYHVTGSVLPLLFSQGSGPFTSPVLCHPQLLPCKTASSPRFFFPLSNWSFPGESPGSQPLALCLELASAPGSFASEFRSLLHAVHLSLNFGSPSLYFLQQLSDAFYLFFLIDLVGTFGHLSKLFHHISSKSLT